MRKCHLDCMYCYMNRRQKQNHKGHVGYRPPRRPYLLPVWEDRAVQRPTGDAGSEDRAPPRGDLLSQSPLAMSYLTDSRWDDGGARERATLTVFADGPVWKISLNDRAMERVCFVTGDTIEACVQLLEEQLATDACAWRASAFPSKRTKKT